MKLKPNQINALSYVSNQAELFITNLESAVELAKRNMEIEKKDITEIAELICSMFVALEKDFPSEIALAAVKKSLEK